MHLENNNQRLWFVNVCLSISFSRQKNPLPHARKIAYMKKMFRKYAKNIITSKSRNVFDIAVELT